MAEPFWLRTGKPSPLTFKTFHSGHGWPSQFCVVRSLPTHSRPFLSSLCFPTPSPSIGKDMTISEVGFSPILWSTPSSITILSLDEKSLIHQYQKLLSKLFVASQQSFLLKVGGKISQRERERERCPISKWWPVQTEFTLQIVNLTLLRLTNFTMFSVFFVLKWSSATAAYIRTNFHLAVVIATLWMWLAWLG